MELVNDTQHKVILEVLFGVVWLKRKNGTLDALSKNVRCKGLKINDRFTDILPVLHSCFNSLD